jgi:hypothetical protein
LMAALQELFKPGRCSVNELLRGAL